MRRIDWWRDSLPACRPVRLLAGDAEGGVEREAVEVPGRWPGTRRAVGSHKRVALDLRRPPLLAVEPGQPFQRRPVGDPGRLAREHEIDAAERGGDRAGRVRGQVAGFAGPGPAHDI